MKTFKYAILASFIVLFACEEEGVQKVPFTRATGEFVADFELTQPFETQESHHFKIYNTSGRTIRCGLMSPIFLIQK